MNSRAGNTSIAILATLVAIFIWGAAAYLIFVVPHNMEAAADLGTPLSSGTQMLFSASDFFRHYAIFLSPVFIIIAGLPFAIASRND